MSAIAVEAVPSSLNSTPVSGAQAVAATLVELGVDVVFGYPGGAIMPIYDALHARNDLRHVLVRHEQAAVHAAEGVARTTGRPAVCMATSGPGATNLITGLADAMMDSTPLVCITGQVASTLLGSDAFQEVDIIGMTLSCTKWNCQVTNCEDISRVIQTAFKVATQGRPGPVLIDITKDAQIDTFVNTRSERGEWETEPPSTDSIWEIEAPREDLSGLPEAAALLNNAQRPMLLIGQGVLLSGAERVVVDLAERGQIPIASTLLGLSAVPPGHPLYVGMLGLHGNLAPNLLTNEADVIVAVGMRFDDRVTGRVDSYAPNATIIHVEIDPAEIGKNVPVAVGLVADAKVALGRLLTQIEPASHDDWLQRFADHYEQEWTQVIAPEIQPEQGPLRMGEVVRSLSQQTDGEAIVCADVGQHQMHVARYFDFKQSLSHISSGGLGTMGYALPAAIGAAIANPKRTTIAIAGDGGFQMNLQELGTIMQEGLPVKMMILNNGYLGMVRQLQELYFDGRYSQVHMDNPDFVQICNGFRIAAERIETREELEAGMQRMLETPGAYLLDIAVAKEDNVFPMIPPGGAVDEIRLR